MNLAMLPATDTLLVVSTFPDPGKAREIGRMLVVERLAACVNVFAAPVESIYAWQGKLEESTEALAFIKTTRAAYPALETRLRELHPYDVPEIVGLSLATGLPDYLRWVAENCTGDAEQPPLAFVKPADESGGART